MYGVLILASVFAVAAIALAIHGGKIDKKMDAISLYRIASCLVAANIISGVICFFAICLALSGPKIEGLTNQEAIVDILGVLTTILMGWNIVSLVDFKKKADEVDHITQDFKNVIGGFMQLNFNSFPMRGRNSELLDNCFQALEDFHTCLNDDIRQMVEVKLMDLIKRVCDNMINEENNIIFAGKKNHYLHILSHIDSKYTKDVEEFIEGAKATEYLLSDEQGREFVIKEGKELVV